MLLTRCGTSATAIHTVRQRWQAAFPALAVKPATRWLHQTSPAHSPFTIAPLPERKFVRVQGSDAVSFLQGLMTNDMRHLEHSSTVYAMFLKANGRVFCDTIIYKRPGAEPADYLLECDAAVAPRLEKHLKLYRLRKKVQVEQDATYRVWAAFKEAVQEEEEMPAASDLACPEGRLHVFKDPRLPRLGYRVLTDEQEPNECKTRLKRIFPEAETVADSALPYTAFRYSLGVGEGETNLPDGKCFPLECNCDLLHGVSFHKGCYIGQELTARTYHTGVIRKRLMPLELDAPHRLADCDPEALRDAEIKNEEGGAVGKLRGLAGNRALGLLRIEKVLPEGKPLTINVAGESVVRCRTNKPAWWPKEMNARPYKTMATTSAPSSTVGRESAASSASEPTAHPSIPFRCELCGLSESCDYRGRRPPFASKIELPEECYVMRDPFAPPPQAVPDKPASEHYLLLGADCHSCRRTVCKAGECSFFYGATFCRQCSVQRVQDFPLEVRSKIKKQFS